MPLVGPPIGAPWRCWIRRSTADAPEECNRDLVLEKQIAVEAGGGIDDLFGYNGPTQMTTRILHKPEYSSQQTLDAFDAVIRDVRENASARTNWSNLKVKWRSIITPRSRRARRLFAKVWPDASLACFTLFDNQPQLVNTIWRAFLRSRAKRFNPPPKNISRNERRAIVFRTPIKAGVADSAGKKEAA